MSNKVLIGGIIASIVVFVLGYLIYGLALKGFFAAETAEGVMRAEEDMVWWALIAGHVTMGFLLAIIIGKWARISTFASGAQAGALIGLLVGLTYNLMNHAVTTTATLKGGLADAVVTAVIAGIAGGIVGWWMGRDKT